MCVATSSMKQICSAKHIWRCGSVVCPYGEIVAVCVCVSIYGKVVLLCVVCPYGVVVVLCVVCPYMD